MTIAMIMMVIIIISLFHLKEKVGATHGYFFFFKVHVWKIKF